MTQSAAPVPGNPDVINFWAGLYGQEEYSDCNVVFLLETLPPGVTTESGEEHATEDSRTGPTEPASARPGSVIGEPLPAHSCILRPACEKWNQQWLKWTDRPDSDAQPSKRRKLSADQAVAVTITEAGGGDPGLGAGGPTATLVPEICIAVRGKDDVPAALAVVRFAYTGRVEAHSVTEALQVWRQADYLQMPRCMEACLALVREKLANEEGAGARSGSGGSASAAGGNSSSSTADAAIEFFKSFALWPDAATAPSYAGFVPLRTEAKRRLAAHFGSALAVLNSKSLFKQLRALPAAGLEALLESDDFGTDSESSVVLLLARWMKQNYGTTDAPTRRRLCGLLRLCQCSRAYLDWVLPALALDHHCHPDTRAGWFPITPAQAGWLGKYVGSAEAMKEVLWDNCDNDMPEDWLNSTPRRYCVPADGLTFTYSISREELVDAFAGLSEKQYTDVASDESIWAMGLEWYVELGYMQGDTEARVLLVARVPASYEYKSGTVYELNKLCRPTEALRADLRMTKWLEDGSVEEVDICPFNEDEVMALCSGWGDSVQLSGAPAAPAPPEPAAQQEEGEEAKQQRQAREAAVAAQWAPYLKDGRLTGTVVVLPHGDEDEDAG